MTLLLSKPRIRDLLEGPAHEEEGEHDRNDRHTRGDDPPPRDLHRLGDVGCEEDLTPTHPFRIPVAEEAEARLGQDRPPDGDDRVGEAEGEDVRSNVNIHDAPVPAPGDASRADERAMPEAQDLCAD